MIPQLLKNKSCTLTDKTQCFVTISTFNVCVFEWFDSVFTVNRWLLKISLLSFWCYLQWFGYVLLQIKNDFVTKCYFLQWNRFDLSPACANLFPLLFSRGGNNLLFSLSFLLNYRFLKLACIVVCQILVLLFHSFFTANESLMCQISTQSF